MHYIHRIKYYSALKGKEILQYAATWINLEDIMLSEINQSQTDKYYKVKSLCRVRLFATPWAVAYQAPLSMDFPGNSPRMDCHSLLQGIFPTQRLNPGLPHCRQTLYRLSGIKYYSALKGKEILQYAATWINLEDIMLSEIRQPQNEKYYIMVI